MTTVKPPRQRRKQARPGEIIEAALSLFQKKGFAASKIEDIASAANVTKGTVYLYFPSKEDLFKAVIRETIIPNIDRLEKAAENEQNASAKLDIVLQLWATGLSRCRGSFTKLIIAEAGNFPDLAAFYREEVINRMRGLLGNIIETGIASGEFSPCDPTVVVRTLIAPILISNIWQHTFSTPEDPAYDPVEMAGNALRIVLNGITPRTTYTPHMTHTKETAQ